MVMQVFRGGDDGDSRLANPSSPGGGETLGQKKTGRRWFFDAGSQTAADGEDHKATSIPSPHFLKFAARKPAFDFSEPKPA